MAEQSFSIININTSKKISSYTQGQQLAARVLFILWLLASSSPEGVFAVPQSPTAIEQLPTSTHGEQDLPGSPASVLSSNVASTSPKVEQLPTSTYGEQGFPDSPASVSSSNVASTSPETGQALKEHYQERFFEVPSFFPEDPRTPMDQIQGHLMLLEQVQEAAPEGKENQLMAIHKRIECRKGPIALCDLFKKRSIEPDGPIQEISKVLVIGEAGTGKTTLAQKLAYDWAQGTWGQELTAVYLLSVCALEQDHYNGDTRQRAPTLATAIVRECFPALHWDKNEDFKRLHDQVQEKLEHPTTLVILDGLNERQGAQEAILREAMQGDHKLLLISRPYGIADHERQKATIEIKHQGFNDTQMHTYVQAYFQEDAILSEQLLKIIKASPDLKTTYHIPANLKILCALWREDQKGVREANMYGSLPGLYRRLTGYMWQRFLEGYQNDQKYQSQVAEDRESLFTFLGNMAFRSMEQGSVLIGGEQMNIDGQQVQNKQVIADILVKSGLLKKVRCNKYKFAHFNFREYFAGSALAEKLLLQDEHEQTSVKAFLSRHKYNPQYRTTLSFMAGELSRGRGLEGIQQLLRLLEQDQEVVGLQHLLLQLRVIHEWLCIASDQEATRGMEDLEEEFEVMACLKKWFCTGLEQVRLSGPGPSSPGGKILGLLTDSLQVSSSVLRQAPEVLDLLQQYAKYKKKDVLDSYSASQAAVETLGEIISVVPEESSAILEILCTAAQDKRYSIRQAAIEALEKAMTVVSQEALEAILKTLRTAAQDKHYSVRQAALKAFGQAISAFPEESEKILNTLQKAVQAVIQKVATTKNISWKVRQTATSLEENISAIPEESSAILKILQEAAKNPGCEVRQAAVKALGEIIVAVTQELEAILKTLRTATSDQSAVEALGRSISVIYQESAILKTLCAATKDPDCDVCQAAVEALGEIISVVPEESSAILETLQEAAKDLDCDIRQAAVEALGEIISVVPEESSAILKTLCAATKDPDCDVCQAAVEALGEIISVVPEESSAILEILQEAAKDLDCDVCQAAVEALGKAILVVPQKMLGAILKILCTAAAESKHFDIRQAAIKALGRSTLALLQEQERSILARPQEWQLILSILRTAAKDEWYTVRQAAVEALGEIISIVPEESSAILKTLRIAATKDSGWPVRQAAVKALGKAISVVYQEALGAILYTLRIAATKDSGWPVRQAAVKALGKAISVAPQKNTILGALHKVVKDAECKCLQRVFASIGRAISPFPSELGAILHTLCTAANDKRYTVRQAAIQALARVPIEQLIDDYWATNEDRRLVPIAHRLYEISLVITPQSQATLYRAEGNCITWQQPTEALKRFASLIKYKATQMIIMKSLKTVPQRPQDYARWLESIQAFGLGNHPEVASVLRMVATAYHDVGQYEESVRYFKQALAMQQALHKGKKHDDVAEALIDIGIVCERLDNYEEAFEYYQQAFQMYVGLHKGKSHDDIAKALNYMGVVCERLDNYGEALKYYQQAFQMYRALYKGKNYDDVAKALTDMGIVCERLDNYKEALKYYQQALQTYIALHKGKKHDDVAEALRTVGVAYEGLGQHEQSLDYYQKALAMQQALHKGQNDAQIAQLLKNIGDAYVSLNHLKAAIQYYEQALAVPEMSKATKASTGHNLGCMYHVKALAFRKAEDEQQAQAYLEKANTSFEQSIQALGKVNAGVYTEYGNFLLATQKFSQAYDYLHKVIANGDKNNGLSYGLLKQTIVTPVLQAYISQQHKASLRGIDYAYYLMILHYDDFQKAGITMDKTKEEYLAAYQASLDQHKGHPEQAQADRAAYFPASKLIRSTRRPRSCQGWLCLYLR